MIASTVREQSACEVSATSFNQSAYPPYAAVKPSSDSGTTTVDSTSYVGGYVHGVSPDLL